MRVKFGDHIDECTRVTNPKGSATLIFESNNGTCTVDFTHEEYAKDCIKRILVNGYVDLSRYSCNSLIKW